MTISNEYKLINPYIEGSFKTNIKSKNAARAGKKFYKNLSKHFSNNLDEYYFTIQDTKSGLLSHFQVKEKVDTNKFSMERNSVIDINLKFKMFSGGFPDEINNKLVNTVNGLIEQSGGFIDFSDSSDDELFNNTLPITRYVYFHMPYYKLVGLTAIDAARLYIPCFHYPILPVTEIRVDFYRWF